ncbi:adhesion G-protein coupled receptor G6-like [Ciona intestinalis]
MDTCVKLICLLFLITNVKSFFKTKDACPDNVITFRTLGREIKMRFNSVKVGEMSYSRETCHNSDTPLASIQCTNRAGYPEFDLSYFRRSSCKIKPLIQSTTATKETSHSTSSTTEPDPYISTTGVLLKATSIESATITSIGKQSTTLIPTAPRQHISSTKEFSTSVSTRVSKSYTTANMLTSPTENPTTKGLTTNVAMQSTQMEIKKNATHKLKVKTLHGFLTNHATSTQHLISVKKAENYLHMAGEVIMTSQNRTMNTSDNNEFDVTQTIQLIDVIITHVNLTEVDSVLLTSANFVMDLRRVLPSNDKPLSFNNSHYPDVRFVIPSSVVKQSNSTLGIRVGFTLFQNAKLFPSKKYKVYKVISAKVTGLMDNTVLKDPVKFTLPANQSSMTSLSCGFWDFEASDWSKLGCIMTSQSPVTCQCNHMTNFAVLITIHTQGNLNKPSTQGNNLIFLDYISNIGCSLSIVGLIATIIIHALFKKLHRHITQHILLHLSMTLLFSYLLYVCGINATQNFTTCLTIATLLHFFWLCAWCWMSVESYTMYVLLVQVLGPKTSHPHFIRRACVFSYLTPACVVGFTVLYCVCKVDHYFVYG